MRVSVGSSEAGGRRDASVGDFRSIPNNRNQGFSLVDSCGVFLYVHRTPGRNLSHWLWKFATGFLSIVLRVQFRRSTIPSHWGWYAVVLSLFTPRSSQMSFITCARRFAPRSESGTPSGSGIRKVKIVYRPGKENVLALTLTELPLLLASKSLISSFVSFFGITFFIIFT